MSATSTARWRRSCTPGRQRGRVLAAASDGAAGPSAARARRFGRRTRASPATAGWPTTGRPSGGGAWARGSGSRVTGHGSRVTGHGSRARPCPTAVTVSSSSWRRQQLPGACGIRRRGRTRRPAVAPRLVPIARAASDGGAALAVDDAGDPPGIDARRSPPRRRGASIPDSRLSQAITAACTIHHDTDRNLPPADAARRTRSAPPAIPDATGSSRAQVAAPARSIPPTCPPAAVLEAERTSIAPNDLDSRTW